MRFELLEPRSLLSDVTLFQPVLGVSRRVVGTAITPIQVATPAGSTVPSGGAFSPQQIRAAYGINLLSQEGVGQTIAIIDAYDNPKFVSSSNTAAYATSDLHDFDAYYGLPDFGGSGPTFTKLDENGGTNYPATQSGGNWESEIALDVEWAHAIAPLANIVLIEASSSGDADLLVTSVNTARNLPGVSVVSMSFMTTDSAFDTMYDPDYTTPSGHTPITFLAATGDSGAPVSYPAASENVVAVGGTSLTLNSGSYGSEMGWSGSGGGIRAYEPQPSYQAGLVIHNGGSTVSAGGKRANPDVAFDANPNTGVSIYDSYDGGSSPWYQIGGTSLATPCWAGLIALADQIRVTAGEATLDGPTQTLPTLYALPAADFHDITSGKSTGSPNYTAAAGYDLVTGLGTPVANLLVPDLAGVSTPITLGPGSLPAGTVNTAYDQAITATGGTGTITLTVSNIENAIAGLTVPASGSGSLTISGTPTASGTETFTVTATDTAGDTTSVTYSITFNAAPTVATPAAATPATVTGTTTALSVLGADDAGEANLTYTWATTGTPPAAVSFSANGSNAAKNTTATFSKAGSYTFQVTITDDGGLTTTSSVTVTVNQTLTSIAVTPATPALASHATQQFTAAGLDQFGNAMSLGSTTWTATAGSITSGGLFTAPYTSASVTVTATSGAVSGTTAVTVTDAAPTVATAAAATPATVTGTTTALSVLGADDAGESNLTYTWATTGTPPAAVSFSANGSNAAKNTTATFSKAGSYTFQVTITDAGGLSATSSVTVTVNQTLTSITVTPATPSLASHATQQFTAAGIDQFGNAMSLGSTTWSATAGSITSRRAVHGPLHFRLGDRYGHERSRERHDRGDRDRCGPHGSHRGGGRAGHGDRHDHGPLRARCGRCRRSRT